MAQPISTVDATQPAIAANVARFDGRIKVTGGARYGSDPSVVNPAYAYLVTSAIARGHIRRIDDSDTRTLKGVLDVMTYENMAGRIKPGKLFSDHGYMATTIQPLASERIEHAGEIVAVILADTYEAARDGAHRLKIAYAE